MRRGLLVRAFSSFYYVLYNGEIWECRSRGKFKNQHQDILVGDRVLFSCISEQDKKGVLEEILPRQNQLLRPAIANIDLLVIIMAAAMPDPNFVLLDRMLLFAEYYGIPAAVAFNKTDLLDDEKMKELTEPYISAGYPVLSLSVLNGRGLKELQKLVSGKVAAFAGPSGVGKSSLLNALNPLITVKTGTVSEKNKRGRHTTRYSEFYQLSDGTVIADTPGFTSFENRDIEKEDLWRYYPEFKDHEKNCRFAGCSHISEPDCGIKNAVEDGKISPIRYDNYCKIYGEIASRRKY